ncbi:MAG: hypothetical protein Q7S08_01765 [bacterium]|nr:hypothetical protein [bacterium]
MGGGWSSQSWRQISCFEGKKMPEFDLQLTEATKQMFPLGTNLLQHMLQQNVGGVTILKAGYLGTVTLFPDFLVCVLRDSTRATEPGTVRDLEEAFREASSAFGIKVPE